MMSLTERSMTKHQISLGFFNTYTRVTPIAVTIAFVCVQYVIVVE